MSSPPEPDLSVCIVTWNVAADLRACLRSLAEQGGGVRLEVLVVDNASTDETVAMLEAEFPAVEVLANTQNRGFAAGTNQALARGRGPYLLLLNPDTICPAGAMRALVQFADAHPEAGLVGPKLLDPDGTLQPSCRRFPTLGAALFRHTLLGRLFPRARAAAEYIMDDFDHASVREVDWVSGACMLVRREAYAQIGPLDEGFFWGSEDVDYCRRARGAGWQVLYTPEPAITHAVGRSSSQAVARTIVRFHRSMYRLYAKHYARHRMYLPLIALGVSARCALLLAARGLEWLWAAAPAAVRRRGEGAHR